MTRTRAIFTSGRGETLPETIVEAPPRGRGRARAIGCAHGTTLARGRACGAAPARGHARESFTQSGGVTATPQDSQTREWDQTQEQQQAPVISDTVGQPPVDPVVGNDRASVVGGQIAPLVVLTEDEQRRYEKF
ncbi:hypothetical protein KY285_010307 [Solanum tuberosum]|nr:hypothetical protein KY289_010850 [Solanum tuberosum]KAH0734600.1 hypothetical protein KY285_010307 [Solanum tuberosum]